MAVVPNRIKAYISMPDGIAGATAASAGRRYAEVRGWSQTLMLLLARLLCAGLMFAQSIVLQTGGPGHAWPRYGFGYAVSWTLDFQTVTLSNPDGSRRWTVGLSIPDVQKAVIVDAAVCPGGNIVLATGLTSASGQAVAANVRLNAEGKITDVTRTTPYASMRLACTPSGTIWSVGTEGDSTSQEKPEYAVIRHYNAAGVQDSEMLGRGEAGGHPWHPSSRGFLRADDEGFVLLSTRIEKIFLASRPEFQVRQASLIPPPECGEITGAALLKNTIAVSCEKSSYPDPKGETTFSLMYLDRATGALVRPPAQVAGPVAILGEDNGKAVLLRTRGREVVKIDPAF